MSESDFVSEFDKKFETIEETLKFIADTQAKNEWLYRQEMVERREFEKKSRAQREKTQRQLDYITKLTGVAFEEITFQEDKLQAAAESLQGKNS